MVIEAGLKPAVIFYFYFIFKDIETSAHTLFDPTCTSNKKPVMLKTSIGHMQK